ncbi:AbrB family transcriptional regulator [Hoeflea prorocentri]|uniref:AbrB family transcriptional regulator n=1 Tax=Hoeflea prorocentri TaxID=1922333 RepID=A0A9X3ULD3_9HYPH|nr:AbrB family transcriptional regulator [Hoeflea prorocentri]MCY6382550.1 AbrB family transcriptional regulator [Hoeflea prorocentri]MDA5400350.1 AbrB family transcriptional regulator [Hoeflea prorocentri]
MLRPGSDAAAILLTLAIGGVGLAAALFLGFPAPALTGPALAVTAFSVASVRLKISASLRNLCFVVIGLSMGTGVTPEVYEAARQWPLSFVLLAVSICIIFFACTAMLRRFWKQGRETAILSSTPGHLSYILGLSSQTRGDIPTISVIQSTRVLALTLLVPFAVSLMGYDTSIMGLPGATMDLYWLAVSLACALVLGFLLHRFRVPAALLLGGMIFSTLTHLTGLVEGHVPQWAVIPAFAIMGSLIGTRFSGVALSTLRRALGAGLVVTAIAFVVTIACAALLVQFIDLPFPQILIAFAPGGVESMAAVAVILGADPTFVAAHHVWRLVILTFLAPAVLGRTQKQTKKNGP